MCSYFPNYYQNQYQQQHMLPTTHVCYQVPATTTIAANTAILPDLFVNYQHNQWHCDKDYHQLQQQQQAIKHQQQQQKLNEGFAAQKRRFEESKYSLEAAPENSQHSSEWNQLQQPLRCEATVRERNRMYHLNQAFDELRNAIPKSSAFENRRLSKIATLRLAIQYIGTLSRILHHCGGICPLDQNSTTSAAPHNSGQRRKRRCKEEDNAHLTSQTNQSEDPHPSLQCIDEAYMWTVDSNVIMGLPNTFQYY